MADTIQPDIRPRSKKMSEAQRLKRNATALAWGKANPDYRINWRKKNREKVNKIARNWRKNNPEKRAETSKWSEIKRCYGITRAEWMAVFESQGHCCAACGRSEPTSKHRWHVDHDHETNSFRGILCHNCNASIGHAKDNPSSLRSLAAYLDRSTGGRILVGRSIRPRTK